MERWIFNSMFVCEIGEFIFDGKVGKLIAVVGWLSFLLVLDEFV
jgi:hypothetical protein